MKTIGMKLTPRNPGDVAVEIRIWVRTRLSSTGGPESHRAINVAKVADVSPRARLQWQQ